MLSTLIWLPLVGAIVVAVAPRSLSKLLGMGVAAATLVVGIVAAISYEVDGGMQLEETYDLDRGVRRPLRARPRRPRAC